MHMDLEQTLSIVVVAAWSNLKSHTGIQESCSADSEYCSNTLMAPSYFHVVIGAILSYLQLFVRWCWNASVFSPSMPWYFRYFCKYEPFIVITWRKAVKTDMQPEKLSNVGLLRDMRWTLRCHGSLYHPVRLQGCGVLPLCAKGHAEGDLLPVHDCPAKMKETALFSGGSTVPLIKKKKKYNWIPLLLNFNAYFCHIFK